MSDQKPNPDKARDLAKKPLTPTAEESISEEDLDKVSGGAGVPTSTPPKTYLCTNE
jgi:hypothetical protein